MSESTSIGLKKSTKELLNSIKKTGQSYDGLLQDLAKVYIATKPN